MGCPLFAGGMGAPGARGADDSASSPSVVRDLGGTWAGKKEIPTSRRVGSGSEEQTLRRDYREFLIRRTCAMTGRASRAAAK
jgi:hypothetical protein